MSEEEIDRKIAVIFATDVVGYSKHMEADESETVKNLRVCEKLLSGLFDKHKGRLFNTGGDSFLAEFPSAVSAVECAVEFQNAIKERNASDEATVKLQFRIGINSGDVIKEKDSRRRGRADMVRKTALLEGVLVDGPANLPKWKAMESMAGYIGRCLYWLILCKVDISGDVTMRLIWEMATNTTVNMQDVIVVA